MSCLKENALLAVRNHDITPENYKNETSALATIKSFKADNLTKSTKSKKVPELKEEIENLESQTYFAIKITEIANGIFYRKPKLRMERLRKSTAYFKFPRTGYPTTKMLILVQNRETFNHIPTTLNPKRFWEEINPQSEELVEELEPGISKATEMIKKELYEMANH
ncbi:unnamed protein product [Cercopithifilaria johnstoni]|uniref:Uncharacterized protein n=1 Tax=Cercopithifilaria johnstoni TaxID=2874296 RepID=A0A8J2MR38_9BILA|nr:unnamed protein product [Cercopithifilaria johnstoni]